MHTDHAILSLVILSGKRVRFLPTLARPTWRLLAHAGLPRGWQLHGPTEAPLPNALPILFDALGPADPEPLLATWIRHGRLVWPRHEEIERAAELASRGIADLLCVQESWRPAAPPFAVKAADCPLPDFAQRWEAYDVACQKLLTLTERLEAIDGPWSQPPAWTTAWQRYLESIRLLTAASQRLLDYAEASGGDHATARAS